MHTRGCPMTYMMRERGVRTLQLPWISTSFNARQTISYERVVDSVPQQRILASGTACDGLVAIEPITTCLKDFHLQSIVHK
jgi:hypothetical protein